MNRARALGGSGGLDLEAVGGRVGRELVLRHGERRQRGAGVLPRPGGHPGVERRLELRAKALVVEGGELGLVARVGVDPLREQRDVDLPLPVGHVRRARRLDASGDRCALRPGLLAVPARRLIGRPGGGHRGHREQHGGHELEVAVEAGLLPVLGHDETRAPRASHGTGASDVQDGARGVEDPQRPLHRHRLDLAQAGAVGVVERVDRGQREHDHRGRRPHEHRLGRPRPRRCPRRTA